MFKPKADLQPLLTWLAAQSIERMVPTVPVLLVQGTADKLVQPAGVAAWARRMCQVGKPVFLRRIKGGSHRDALRDSPEFGAEFLAWLDSENKTKPCHATP